MLLKESAFDDYVSAIEANDIIEAKNILLRVIKDDARIYRYRRGTERDLSNLIDKKIRLCNVFNLNDPYDCTIMVDCGMKAEYPKEESEKALEDYLRQQKKNMDMAAIRSKLFVASFSETNTSFPMWGYYADEHKGICLGYDLKKLIKRYCCFPVIYREELTMYSEQDDTNILFSALTKSSEWSHEREWRIVENCCEHEGESGIILDNFPNPVEIYIGIRHKDTVYDLIDIKERDYKADEKYTSLLDITDYAEKESIDLYLPVINRKEYKLIPKALNLNL